MFRDKRVEIWIENDTITTDEYGTRTKGQPYYYKYFMATVQPTSREVLVRKYGYDLQVTLLIICDIDEDIKEFTILKYKDKFYKVIKAPTWDNHMEVFCDQWELKLN